MTSGLIEHRGIVQRIDGGRAVIAMETGGCSSCGHGAGCGIGKLAEGRAATLLTVPARAGLQPGDAVSVGLSAGKLRLSALLGYLFPAFATLLGAWFGASFEGSDGATALGAAIGFFGALAVARLLIGRMPGLMPSPRLVSESPLENHDDYRYR